MKSRPRTTLLLLACLLLAAGFGQVLAQTPDAAADDGTLYLDAESMEFEHLAWSEAPLEEMAAYYLRLFPDDFHTPASLARHLAATDEAADELAEYEIGSGTELQDRVAHLVLAMRAWSLIPEDERADAMMHHPMAAYSFAVAENPRLGTEAGSREWYASTLLYGIANQIPPGLPDPCMELQRELADGLVAPLDAEAIEEIEARLEEQVALVLSGAVEFPPCELFALHLVYLNQTGSDRFLDELLPLDRVGQAILGQLSELGPDCPAKERLFSELLDLARVPFCGELTDTQRGLEPMVPMILGRQRDDPRASQILMMAAWDHGYRPTGPLRFFDRREEMLDILMIEPEGGFSRIDRQFLEERAAGLRARAEEIDAALGGGVDDDPAGSN